MRTHAAMLRSAPANPLRGIRRVPNTSSFLFLFPTCLLGPSQVFFLYTYLGSDHIFLDETIPIKVPLKPTYHLIKREKTFSHEKHAQDLGVIKRLVSHWLVQEKKVIVKTNAC